MIYVFAEKDLCCGRVANEGERRGGGGGEGEVDDGEGIEHGEEVEGHTERSGKEEWAGKNGADRAKVPDETGAGAEVVEVAEAAHSCGDEDFAGDGKGGDCEDGGPGMDEGSRY